MPVKLSGIELNWIELWDCERNRAREREGENVLKCACYNKISTTRTLSSARPYCNHPNILNYLPFCYFLSFYLVSVPLCHVILRDSMSDGLPVPHSGTCQSTEWKVFICMTPVYVQAAEPSITLAGYRQLTADRLTRLIKQTLKFSTRERITDTEHRSFHFKTSAFVRGIRTGISGTNLLIWLARAKELWKHMAGSSVMKAEALKCTLWLKGSCGHVQMEPITHAHTQ